MLYNAIIYKWIYMYIRYLKFKSLGVHTVEQLAREVRSADVYSLDRVSEDLKVKHRADNRVVGTAVHHQTRVQARVERDAHRLGHKAYSATQHSNTK